MDNHLDFVGTVTFVQRFSNQNGTSENIKKIFFFLVFSSQMFHYCVKSLAIKKTLSYMSTFLTVFHFVFPNLPQV